jgi:hypothetical protein
VVRFGGQDFRTSYQFHNLRAFGQATEVLLAQPRLDASRLAVAGSSWGGFYSLLLAGLDRRFRHARPVFGCGFLELGCHQLWQAQLATMTPEDVEVWRQTFDPGRRAHLIEADVVYIQATNDRYFGLEGTMRTYHGIPGPKGLVLARNQDHSAHPYHRLSVAALSAQQSGTLGDLVPSVEADWLLESGAGAVSVAAPREAVAAVSICYSSGSYTPWAARLWRQAEAQWDGERWVAELPLADPAREIWFYGHADLANGGVSSSAVRRLAPDGGEISPATISGRLFYDFESEQPHDLPIGDPFEPPKRVVSADGVTGIELTFGDESYLRGAAYCLEGDVLAAGGCVGIELLVRVAPGTDPGPLALGVFTDYGTLEEQAYGVPLAGRVAGTGGAWEPVAFAFDELVPQPHRAYPPHRGHPFVAPAARPLDVSRLCAVGVLRSNRLDRGTVAFANVRVLQPEVAA